MLEVYVSNKIATASNGFQYDPDYYHAMIKEETCQECGGSGKDNDSLDYKCYHCMGLKKIRYIGKDYK